MLIVQTLQFEYVIAKLEQKCCLCVDQVLTLFVEDLHESRSLHPSARLDQTYKFCKLKKDESVQSIIKIQTSSLIDKQEILGECLPKFL